MSLTLTYLGKVTIAEHGGIVRQIVGKLQGASISNEMYTLRLNDLVSAAQAEDDAYTHSLKDFNSDRLHEEDSVTDMYVKAVRAILNGYAELPESEPNRQKAVELVRVFKDYGFSPSDSYTAEAEKIRNMDQVFQTRLADLQALGVAGYWAQTATHAQNVEQLLSQRFDDIAARVVGEMKTARADTDQAVKAMYELLAAMKVMTPSAELTALIAQLDAIEAYAWQYYLGGKKSGSGSSSSSSSSNSSSGSATDSGSNYLNDSDNGSSGSGDSGGGSDSGGGVPDVNDGFDMG